MYDTKNRHSQSLKVYILRCSRVKSYSLPSLERNRRGLALHSGFPHYTVGALVSWLTLMAHVLHFLLHHLSYTLSFGRDKKGEKKVRDGETWGGLV